MHNWPEFDEDTWSEFYEAEDNWDELDDALPWEDDCYETDLP